MSGILVYECSPVIVWVRDAQQTILVNEETGDSWILQDVESVIWDWLAVTRSSDEITQMLSLALSLSVEEAARTFSGVCQNWLEAGILRAAK